MRVVLILAAFVAGCATPPKVPDVVHIPVPTACLKPDQVPPIPALASNATLRAMDPFDRYRTIAAERAELAAWAVQVEPLLQICSRTP